MSSQPTTDARPDRLWLVLPTYNEAENLEAFAARVLPELERASRRPHLLVVDDDSPDGTGRIAARLGTADPRISVLHNGSKRGLGRAYTAGFKHALAAGADLVMQMDADFSHDVADVPSLAAATGEADLVIGSRYVQGGGVADWSLGRRSLSRGGCWYARKVLGIDVRDLTSGFKCYRSSVLSALELDTVRANGYVFQIEMTHRAVHAGYRVAEVPIWFADRRAGTSKMTATVALEAVWKVPALRAGASSEAVSGAGQGSSRNVHSRLPRKLIGITAATAAACAGTSATPAAIRSSSSPRFSRNPNTLTVRNRTAWLCARPLPAANVQFLFQRKLFNTAIRNAAVAPIL